MLNYLFRKLIEWEKKEKLYRLGFDVEYIKRANSQLFSMIVSETQKELDKIMAEIKLLGDPKRDTKRHEKMIELQSKALKINEKLSMRKDKMNEIERGAVIKGELEYQLKMLRTWKP